MKYVKEEYFRDRELFADKTFCRGNIFAIADGMGDRGTGKIAAEVAVGAIEEFIPINDEETMISLFRKANERIIKEITKYGDDLFCGTTLSVLVIFKNSYLIGHVGDSRIYLIRNEKINLLTVDQVHLRGKKRYINALGTSWKPDVYLSKGDIEKNDIFLLISDGIVSLFSEEDLSLLINRDIDQSAKRIISKYKETSPKDDLSLILVRV